MPIGSHLPLVEGLLQEEQKEEQQLLFSLAGGDVSRLSRFRFFGKHFGSQTQSFENLDPVPGFFADLYLPLPRFAVFGG